MVPLEADAVHAVRDQHAGDLGIEDGRQCGSRSASCTRRTNRHVGHHFVWQCIGASCISRYSRPVFKNWDDALKAMSAILVLTLVAQTWANVRGVRVQWPFDPEMPADPSKHKPVDAVDMRNGLIGQIREDKRRRRRTFVWTAITVVVVQFLPLNGYLSTALVVAVAVTVEAGARGFEKIEAAMAITEMDIELRGPNGRPATVLQELRQFARVALAPSLTDPLRGRWRLLGVPAAALTIGVALVGWRAALGLFGAEMRNVADPLHELLTIESAPLLALSGVAVVVLARLPLELAQRFALARPRKAGVYPIVFLRSFEDDRLTIRADGTRSLVDLLTLHRHVGYERVLVASSRHLGPVLALGEPGERVPPLGAFRVYFEQDDWKAGVSSLLENATYLVVSLGKTPSVTWEVSRLKELGLLDRTVFVVPPVAYPARQERLRLLCEQLDLDPVIISSVSSPGEVCVAVMFKEAEPVVLISSGYDATSYFSALLEAGFAHFSNDGAEA